MSVVFSTFSLRRQLSLHFRNISITMFYISFKGKMIAKNKLCMKYLYLGDEGRDKKKDYTREAWQDPRLFPRAIPVKFFEIPNSSDTGAKL